MDDYYDFDPSDYYNPDEEFDPPEEVDLDNLDMPYVFGIAPDGHIVVDYVEAQRYKLNDPTWDDPDYWIRHGNDD